MSVDCCNTYLKVCAVCDRQTDLSTDLHNTRDQAGGSMNPFTVVKVLLEQKPQRTITCFYIVGP